MKDKFSKLSSSISFVNKKLEESTIYAINNAEQMGSKEDGTSE